MRRNCNQKDIKSSEGNVLMWNNRYIVYKRDYRNVNELQALNKRKFSKLGSATKTTNDINTSTTEVSVHNPHSKQEKRTTEALK